MRWQIAGCADPGKWVSSATSRANDIELVLPITLREAVLGARLEVPTPSGRVRTTIPKGASSGTRLRLKGNSRQDAGEMSP